MQLHTICFILCLDDINSANCGQDANNKAVLFDFNTQQRPSESKRR